MSRDNIAAGPRRFTPSAAAYLVLHKTANRLQIECSSSFQIVIDSFAGLPLPGKIRVLSSPGWYKLLRTNPTPVATGRGAVRAYLVILRDKPPPVRVPECTVFQ